MAIFTNNDPSYDITATGFDKNLIKGGAQTDTPEMINIFSGGVAPKSIGAGEVLEFFNVGQAGISGIGDLSTDIRIWAGDAFANRATAEFRVDQAGALFASNATITGTITGALIQTAISGQRIILSSSDNTLRFYTDTNEQLLLSPIAQPLVWYDSSSNARIYINGSSAIPGITLEGDGAGGLGAYFDLHTNMESVATASRIDLRKARGTIDSRGSVLSGDKLGIVRFLGWNTTSEREAASIEVEVDATPGVDSPYEVAGRIIFKTTPENGSSTEAMRISSNKDVTFAGDITISGTSKVRVYRNTTVQKLNTEEETKLFFNAETYDILNEFDSSVKTGIASSTSVNHLVDATLSPFVAGDVGKTVWNTTDNTYAVITAFNSTSDVTISVNIMASTEGYQVYASRFTASKAGYYLITAQARISAVVDQSIYLIEIAKNGTIITTSEVPASGISYLYLSISDIVSLAANDYVEIFAYHEDGSTRDLSVGSIYSYLSIHKLS